MIPKRGNRHENKIFSFSFLFFPVFSRVFDFFPTIFTRVFDTNMLVSKPQVKTQEKHKKITFYFYITLCFG